jgi:hypothetical protein
MILSPLVFRGSCLASIHFLHLFSCLFRLFEDGFVVMRHRQPTHPLIFQLQNETKGFFSDKNDERERKDSFEMLVVKSTSKKSCNIGIHKLSCEHLRKYMKVCHEYLHKIVRTSHKQRTNILKTFIKSYRHLTSILLTS